MKITASNIFISPTFSLHVIFQGFININTTNYYYTVRIIILPSPQPHLTFLHKCTDQNPLICTKLVISASASILISVPLYSVALFSTGSWLFSTKDSSQKSGIGRLLQPLSSRASETSFPAPGDAHRYNVPMVAFPLPFRIHRTFHKEISKTNLPFYTRSPLSS